MQSKRNKLNSFLLYLHTIRHLKLSQIFSRITWLLKNNIFKNRIIQKCNQRKFSTLIQKSSLIPKPVALSVYKHDLGAKSFTLLNKQFTFEDGIAWNHPDLDKLWLYNLHYFEYLLPLTQEISLPNFRTAKEIVVDWIENNPIGYRNGWEPYPTSLRIINWIFFFTAYYEHFEKDQVFKELFLNSLYKQVCYLSHFLEFHLSANHFFENIKSLFAAGLFFQRHSWLKRGWNLLQRELKEQILNDGGHFERCPMYHAIILTDILDLINLLKAFRRGNPAAYEQYFEMPESRFGLLQLQSVAAKMLCWLQNMRHPDGEIPLFGDSALNIAPAPEDIIKYYQKVIGEALPGKVEGALYPSGYYVLRGNGHFLVLDGGTLGVRYQPGHAHCDLFSYEYSYKALRFIVDSGVGNYLETDLRQKARSIYSHNTVVVNEQEQAEMWKVFRVGRWVEPQLSEFHREKEKMVYRGRYQNKLQKNRSYMHERKAILLEDKYLCLEDTVFGNTIDSLESLIHFHPQCELQLKTATLLLSRNGETICILWDPQRVAVEIRPWFYVPEFGKVLDARKMVLQPRVANIRKVCYVIVPPESIREAKQHLMPINQDQPR